MKKTVRSLFLTAIAAALALMLGASVSGAALIPGDADGNGTLNSADAVWLLRHILMPESYAVSIDGDLDGDGALTTADAVYLLRHVLSPELYPLPESGEEEAERESEYIRQTVEAVLSDPENGGTLKPKVRFAEQMTKASFENTLLAFLGFESGYSVNLTEEEYQTFFAAYFKTAWRVTGEMAFSVTGPKGGSASFVCPYDIYDDSEEYMRDLVVERFKAAGVWNGKLSADAELSFAIGDEEIPSAASLEKMVEAKCGLSRIDPKISVFFFVYENEWYESLAEMYADAEIGEEIEEWLDVYVEAEYLNDSDHSDYPQYVWKVDFALHVVIEKTFPDGLCEIDGETCCYLYGERQTGWHYLDGEYLFFDEDGVLVEGKEVPAGLFPNYDAEEEDIVLIRDGSPRFTLLVPENPSAEAKEKIDEVVGKLEEILGGPLPESANGVYNPSGAEKLQNPLLLLGDACRVYRPAQMTDVTLRNYKVSCENGAVLVGSFCDDAFFAAADRFLALIDEYADGDDLVLPSDLYELTDRVLPKSGLKFHDRFEFSVYYTPHPEEYTEQMVKEIAELGITHLEVHAVTSNIPAIRQVVEWADKYGMTVNLWHYFIEEMMNADYWREVTYEGLEQDVKTWLIDAFGDMENITEWGINDEPKVERFEKIGWFNDIIHRLDPGRTIFLNHGNGGGKDFYQKIVDDLDPNYLCYDDYAIFGDEPWIGAPDYLTKMQWVLETGIRNGLPVGMIIQASKWANYAVMHTEQYRWETNLAIAYGYKYLSYFTYSNLGNFDTSVSADPNGWNFGGLVDYDYRPNDRYYALQAALTDIGPVAQQLFDKDVEMVFNIGDDSKIGGKKGKYSTTQYIPYGDLGAVEGDDAVIGFFEDGSFYFVNRILKTGAPANVFTLGQTPALEWFDPQSGEWEDCTLSGKMTGEAGGYTLSLLPGDAILLRAAASR